MYYVMRTHSHTDRQQLWKVMSRPFDDKDSAKSWKRFCEEEETNPNHSFFIIEKEVE